MKLNFRVPTYLSQGATPPPARMPHATTYIQYLVRKVLSYCSVPPCYLQIEPTA